MKSVRQEYPVIFLYKFVILNLISQLPEAAFAKIKERINCAKNVNIVPIHVVEEVSR